MSDDASKSSRLAALIRKAIPGVLRADIADQSVNAQGERRGSGDRFAIVVVSDEAFTNVSLLERQKMVHKAIEPMMAHIHAIELKTWTQAQYDKNTNKSA